MSVPSYLGSLQVFLTPLVLKLMFQSDMEHRMSGPLDVGIGPPRMPDSQSYRRSIQVDNLLRDETKENKVQVRIADLFLSLLLLVLLLSLLLSLLLL